MQEGSQNASRSGVKLHQPLSASHLKAEDISSLLSSQEWVFCIASSGIKRASVLRSRSEPKRSVGHNAQPLSLSQVGFLRRTPNPAPLNLVVNDATFDYVLISEPEMCHKRDRPTAVLHVKREITTTMHLE